MQITRLFVLAAAAGAANSAAAQSTPRASSGFYSYDSRDVEHRAALGVSTTTTGTLRDTLGIMITAITKGSPAEKAGLEEGNRIASINGVSLKASAADVEDNDMSSALTRRLTRELSRLKPGDEVELRVYREGKTQSVKIKTGDSVTSSGPRVTTRPTGRCWGSASAAQGAAATRSASS